MRRNFTKGLMAGVLGMLGLAAGTGALATESTAAPTFGSPIASKSVGGLSPKEYGMRYGNGGSKRSNKLRYAHNAKLKRRMA